MSKNSPNLYTHDHILTFCKDVFRDDNIKDEFRLDYYLQIAEECFRKIHQTDESANDEAIRKSLVIALFQDKCQICQQKARYPTDYEFHHIDPKTKGSSISQIWSRSWEFLLKELRKCILICNICHGPKFTHDQEFGGPLIENGEFYSCHLLRFIRAALVWSYLSTIESPEDEYKKYIHRLNSQQGV